MKNFKLIEEKWSLYWNKQKTYYTHADENKEKFYCLDMFPYPSGAGLHVGHPRGYIASDVLSRFKRMQGFNILHPMGYDAFGLPAEQYAIETGQHPVITTKNNITRFQEQLSKIGFCFDPSREFSTSDPKYYHWTQWIFLQLFNAWYDKNLNKSRSIDQLTTILEKNGNIGLHVVQNDGTPTITAKQWKEFSSVEKSDFLMNYRLAYRAESSVNWCPSLGTVLANDEIKDGLSERGGYPITKRKMKQWMLRITAFSDRLLDNLNNLDWPENLKEIQRNWIGKSIGCEINFSVKMNSNNENIKVFTTHPETIYGCTFLVLAPEHTLTKKITTDDQQQTINDYVALTNSRSDRERMAEVDRITGAFTGAYATHPLTGKNIPVWIADYVLPEYGTGAIMAVPTSDYRDFRFAKKFDLPLIFVFENTEELKCPYEKTHGIMINSRALNGLNVNEAKEKICDIIEAQDKGVRSIKYRIRDAIFGRQRYWGEPIPIYYNEDGIPTPVALQDLPLELPNITDYRPTDEGEPPLARSKNWCYQGNPLETTTMPGWSGSSWYFLRYMDAKNNQNFADSDKTTYWNSVDCYIGGSEHASGHLLYSRFWNLFLYDIGQINFQEPFKKVVCQGMILGQSAIIYRDKNSNTLISADMTQGYEVQPLYVDINFVDRDNHVDIEKLKSWRSDYSNVEFLFNDQQSLLCDRIVEKMSKSKYNVVVPDDIIEQYGADCFRIHEMFLGPIDQSTPWSIQSIEGSYKFLKRVWRLFYNDNDLCIVSDEKPTDEVVKITHQTIKKVSELTESMSFHTAIAALMTCVNHYTKLNIHDRTSLSILLQLLHPYAPFITEELWSVALDNKSSILDQGYPNWSSSYTTLQEVIYSVSINGKRRAEVTIPKDVNEESAKAIALNERNIQKWLEGKTVIKTVFVPNKIINFVVN